MSQTQNIDFDFSKEDELFAEKVVTIEKKIAEGIAKIIIKDFVIQNAAGGNGPKTESIVKDKNLKRLMNYKEETMMKLEGLKPRRKKLQEKLCFDKSVNTQKKDYGSIKSMELDIKAILDLEGVFKTAILDLEKEMEKLLEKYINDSCRACVNAGREAEDKIGNRIEEEISELQNLACLQENFFLPEKVQNHAGGNSSRPRR